MWVGLCTFLDPMGLSNELSCESGSFSCCCLNPQRVFKQRFEALFPRTGALGLHSLFHYLLVPPGLSAHECGTAGSTSHQLVGSTNRSSLASCSLAHPAPHSAAWQGPPAMVLPRVLSSKLRISAPPTSLDECVFFNSLVVRLPYSSIFCQFWLFLFLNGGCPSFGCTRRHRVSTYASILARSPTRLF